MNDNSELLNRLIVLEHLVKERSKPVGKHIYALVIAAGIGLCKVSDSIPAEKLPAILTTILTVL